MQNLVNQLKSMKNATQAQYDDAIYKYAHSEVLKELQEAGVCRDDLDDDEFEELLKEKIKHTKTFAKGAMVASGAILFLELLG